MNKANDIASASLNMAKRAFNDTSQSGKESSDQIDRLIAANEKLSEAAVSQSKTAKLHAEAAKKSAASAERNVAIVLSGERPSLGVVSADLVILKAGEKAQIKVKYQNTGRLPARQAVITSLAYTDRLFGNSSECPELKPDLKLKSIGIASKGNISVNGTRFGHSFNDAILTTDDIKGINEGAVRLYVYQKFTYGIDKRKGIYFTEYYARYDPLIKAFAECDKNNDSN